MLFEDEWDPCHKVKFATLMSGHNTNNEQNQFIFTLQVPLSVRMIPIVVYEGV